MTPMSLNAWRRQEPSPHPSAIAQARFVMFDL